MKRNITMLLVLCVSFFIYAQNNFVKNSNGVTVTLSGTGENGAKLVRVDAVKDNIIRVRAVNADSFPDVKSLMVVNTNSGGVKFDVDQNKDTLFLRTKSLLIKISLSNGGIVFCDASGKTILSEIKNGGKTIEPVTLENKHLFRIRQQFKSPAGEAFYGLGQQQEGLYNYKGHDVDLYQYNTKISIPFVISNKNYGILWDNYSRTKFGDPREYGSLSAFKLYDASGKEGGLTADYYNSVKEGKLFLSRRESQINYEFIPLLKNFPRGFSLAKGKAVWSGTIGPDSSGLYKFRLYSAGHCRMWINNKLMVDRWRQSWNAFVHLFDLHMNKGQK